MTEENETPKPADVAGRLDGLVGRAEALLGLLESDFGQSDRWIRLEAICCEFEAYYSALQELVTLKEMKDRGLDYDDRIEYMDRKPKAWATAKALLTPNR